MLMIAFAEYLTKSDVYLIIPLLCVSVQLYRAMIHGSGTVGQGSYKNKVSQPIKYTYTL